MMTRKILFLLPVAALLFGCVSSEYDVTVNPSNANLRVSGMPPATTTRTATGYKIQFPSSDSPYTIQATLNGYSDAKYVVDTKVKPTGPIKLELYPLTMNKSFSVTSDPIGAQVFVDGKNVGVTPLNLNLIFRRKAPNASWDQRKLSIKLNEWQTEEMTLSSTDASGISVSLSRLHHERTFSVKVETQDGQALEAPITVDGKIVGNSPMNLPLLFERTDKTREWPVYSCKVGIKDEYKEQSFTITRDTSENIKLSLEPVTEVGVRRMMPSVMIGPRGAQYVVDAEPRNALIDTRETSNTVAELRQITAFKRNDHRSPQVNSFAIYPDGQSLVYALSETEDDGTVYSNLWQTATDVTSGSRQRLTSGAYLDACPQLPICDGTQQSLVFQSNRGMRDSVDISSITFSEGHVIGGITQITREARFNYAPVIVRKEWEIFFISSEDHYPQAVQQISYMHSDGSSATYMNETGSDIDITPDGRQVYFVRKDSTTGKYQIYSMPMEGYPVTQVISQEAFNAGNCGSPAINPEGTMMLFTSDIAIDADGRSNRDIFVMNLASGKITPVTTNISDDISPEWSPSEPGVVYFISNRGGTYNVWRLRLTSVQ
jgi:hypothetical protein